MNRNPLARRTFLKGLGVTMALPFLESLVPARGFAAGTAAIPRRLGFVFFPNGAIMQSWTPQSAGPDYELSPTLDPLSKIKGKINVLSGLMQDNAYPKGDGAGDHARSAAAFLTGAHPNKNGEIRLGISVDQVAAEKVGHQTLLPSLELGIDQNKTAGQCDSGYSCAYSSSISWKTPTTPMAKEIIPKLAFERLFGGDESDRESAVKRNARRISVLDAVSDNASRLQQKLGRADRQKVDEYFTSVREIEQRIARVQAHTADREVPDLALPPGLPTDINEHLALMFDLMALAYQTDTTRIASFMLANEGSDRTYRMLGLDTGHHTLSHHQDKAETMEKIQKIDQYLVSRFAAFLEKLDSMPEGDGTVLDHSLIVYGSAIADGNAHAHHDLPVLLAGRGGGTVQTGRHIVYPTRTPMNNLFLSLLDRVDVAAETLGDANGRLSNLEG